MRGAQLLLDEVHFRARIIPAYAGSTPHRWLRRKQAQDHPRVCGEHRQRRAARQSWPGSSPRMRGAPLVRLAGRIRPGIIPAYAGSTFLCQIVLSQVRDHPRVCGEHSNVSLSSMATSRIIPAYAGSTPSRRMSWTRQRDHPRVCGEHPVRTLDRSSHLGSSPRMRGALQVGIVDGNCNGIIPAYAGSTPREQSILAHVEDHPRVCGEHWCRCPLRVSPPGSSPRMRGALDYATQKSTIYGIIPAYAGSTDDIRSSQHIDRDHPRVCGEHYRSELSTETATGSSPRMRGAHPKKDEILQVGRIIPAYAGSTTT